ncbi:hypothetical protein ACFLQS_04130 [Actinomycetota bacterium]
MYRKNSKKMIYVALILGICLIISASIVSYTFFIVRSSEDTILVTGSVREKVTSDPSKWNTSFSRTVPAEDLKLGYDQMKIDQDLVLSFFLENGFKERGVTNITSLYETALYV